MELEGRYAEKMLIIQKPKKTGSAKIGAKFETLRREIKADIRNQYDLYVNNSS